MFKESKYCFEVIKTHFNKKLVITNKKDAGFENPTKCWIYDNT